MVAQKFYRFVRKKELPQYIGLQDTQINVLIKNGLFPKPIKLGGEKGRAVAFLESEIIAWQEQRLKERS